MVDRTRRPPASGSPPGAPRNGPLTRVFTRSGRRDSNPRPSPWQRIRCPSGTYSYVVRHGLPSLESSVECARVRYTVDRSTVPSSRRRRRLHRPAAAAHWPNRSVRQSAVPVAGPTMVMSDGQDVGDVVDAGVHDLVREPPDRDATDRHR